VVDVAEGLGIGSSVVEAQARGNDDLRHRASIESPA
jgi:hypothetical protein